MCAPYMYFNNHKCTNIKRKKSLLNKIALLKLTVEYLQKMKEEVIFIVSFCSLFSIFVDLSGQEFDLVDGPDGALPSLHPHEAFVQGQVVANSVLRQRKQNFVKVHTKEVAHCEENPIYVLPEKKPRGLSPSFQIHVSVSDLYISTIAPPIFPTAG
jgi:hypothetical protein